MKDKNLKTGLIAAIGIILVLNSISIASAEEFFNGTKAFYYTFDIGDENTLTMNIVQKWEKIFEIEAVCGESKFAVYFPAIGVSSEERDAIRSKLGPALGVEPVYGIYRIFEIENKLSRPTGRTISLDGIRRDNPYIMENIIPGEMDHDYKTISGINAPDCGKEKVKVYQLVSMYFFNYKDPPNNLFEMSWESWNLNVVNRENEFYIEWEVENSSNVCDHLDRCKPRYTCCVGTTCSSPDTNESCEEMGGRIVGPPSRCQPNPCVSEAENNETEKDFSPESREKTNSEKDQGYNHRTKIEFKGENYSYVLISSSRYTDNNMIQPAGFKRAYNLSGDKVHIEDIPGYIANITVGVPEGAAGVIEFYDDKKNPKNIPTYNEQAKFPLIEKGIAWRNILLTASTIISLILFAAGYKTKNNLFYIAGAGSLLIGGGAYFLLPSEESPPEFFEEEHLPEIETLDPVKETNFHLTNANKNNQVTFALK